MLVRLTIALGMTAAGLSLPPAVAAQDNPPAARSTDSSPDPDGTSPSNPSPQGTPANPPATQPTPAKAQRGAPPVNDDEGLEHEADVMGEKALSPH